MEFSRAQWAALRDSTPLPLTESQLRGLVGLNEWMSLDEVAGIRSATPELVRGTGTLEELERRHIEAALRRCAWKINGPGNAAESLGLHPNTLRFRMKKLGIRRPVASNLVVGGFRRSGAG